MSKHGWGSVIVWTTSWKVSLVLTDDLARSYKINLEVCRVILTAHPNVTKLRRLNLTVKMDDDPEYIDEAVKVFLNTEKWNILQWPKQSSDLSAIEHNLSEGRMDQKPSAAEGVHNEALAKHFQQRHTLNLRMFMGSHTVPECWKNYS